MNWMLMPLRRYADFQGRSRRKEYWMFTLALVLVYLLFAVAIGVAAGGALAAAGATAGANPTGSSAMMAMFAGAGVVGIVFLVFLLGILIPAIAVGVRRLHDTNRTGWWILAPTAINLFGLLFIGTGIDLLFSVLGLVASIALIVFLCIDGTRGPNRFGSDPKTPDTNLDEVFS